ncbi:MAG TPA: hypothetical protein VHV83_03725, partial [Armatimonadota bacterium]|nr:hypothetical protein [Armatimonadota bacterium]
MIQLDMPEWWMKSHPGVPDSFHNLGEAVFSKEWVEEASDYLKSFIAYSEEKYGDRVFAYSFSAGLATEWFDDARFDGSVSEIKQESYRRWLGDPAAVVPTHEEIYDDSGSVFREPNANAIKYMNFCANLTPDLICHFAGEAQSVIHHQKLVGVFFGYMDCPSGPYDWQNRTSTN